MGLRGEMGWRRLALHIKLDRIRIITRGGYDWTNRFPSIVAEARRLRLTAAILDGEAVILDKQGRSDFGMLQRVLGRRPSAHEPAKSSSLPLISSILMAATCADCRSGSADASWSHLLQAVRAPFACLNRLRQTATSF
jgi:bifunctional non-homologous end joining protein LigD